jgi:hypothetical protein
MDALELWLSGLHLSPLLTALLILIVIVMKTKLCQHEEMYKWYLGRLAIEQQEREGE